MASTSTTAKPTTIGVELEFLVVNKPGTPTREKVPPKDNRWPPVPNPEADPAHVDSESMLKICELLAKQGHQVACILDNINPESKDPLLTTQADSKLMRETKTNDHQFKVQELVINEKTKLRTHWNQTDYRVWKKALDESPQKLPLRYAIPNFELERSITSELKYPALEMVTPIISEPTQEKDFLDLVETMRKNFKISINPNCGLHIHAGYQSDPPNASEDLYRAKKVAAMVFLLEKPFILALCHPDRKSAYQLKLISDVSMLAEKAYYHRKHGPLTYDQNFGKGFLDFIGQFRSQLNNRCDEEGFTFAFLEYLFERKGDKAKEAKDFKRGLREDESGTRSSLALRPEMKTIEFRYFECTFDTNMIKFWIEFVRQIFAICNEPKAQFENKFKDLYEMATRKEQKPGWEEWLEKLGLSRYKGTCASYIKRCKESPLDESIILPKSFDL